MPRVFNRVNWQRRSSSNNNNSKRSQARNNRRWATLCGLSGIENWIAIGSRCSCGWKSCVTCSTRRRRRKRHRPKSPMFSCANDWCRWHARRSFANSAILPIGNTDRHRTLLSSIVSMQNQARKSHWAIGLKWDEDDGIFSNSSVSLVLFSVHRRIRIHRWFTGEIDPVSKGEDFSSSIVDSFP